jgi:hypothetical protein
MADLTAVKDDERQNGELVAVSLAAVKVFKGAILTFNSSGYADVGDADEAFAGIAAETVDNSGGSAGDKEVRVWREGIVTLDKGSAVQGDVGKNAFVTDDQTVHVTSAADRVPIGVIVGLVSVTQVRVHLNRNASSIVVDTTT